MGDMSEGVIVGVEDGVGEEGIHEVLFGVFCDEVEVLIHV
jgi:hypothetical protein